MRGKAHRALTVAVVLSSFACSASSNNVDGRDLYGTLSGAVSRDDLGAVLSFLERGDDPNDLDSNGTAPLYTAALRGSPEVVTALLASGARVNISSDPVTFTPIMAAATRQDEDGPIIVGMLLALGADPCQQAPRELAPTLFENALEGMDAYQIATHLNNAASASRIARVADC